MLNKEIKIIIAGFGGQGVVVTGNILAKAAMAEGKQVTGMVAYGAEMRGGTANATVVMSDGSIASPVVERPDIAIILNQPSLDKYEEKIVANGIAVVNTSFVDREVTRKDINVIKINAGEIALKLGNIKVANIAALGALIGKTKLLDAGGVIVAIEDLFSKKKASLVEINKKAFAAGVREV